MSTVYVIAKMEGSVHSEDINKGQGPALLTSEEYFKNPLPVVREETYRMSNRC